jgi:hypothetical protein
MGRDFYEVSEPVDEESVNKYFEFGRVSLQLRYLWAGVFNILFRAKLFGKIDSLLKNAGAFLFLS